MVPFGRRVLLGVLLMAVALQAMPMPQDNNDDFEDSSATPVGGNNSDNPDDLQELENELAEAAAANLAARAIKLEQRLEDEILTAAVATLQDPNPKRRAARMAELGQMVKRDKRTVEAITGLLGASGGAVAGVAGASVSGAARVAGAGSSAATSVAGAAGGVAVDLAQRGSSAGALVGSLVSSVLGASSSAASGASGIGTPNAAGDDPNAGAFSPLRLLSDSVSTVLRIKFSIFRTLFSLVSGLLSASSGSAAAA